jgi:hypothetical protein
VIRSLSYLVWSRTFPPWCWVNGFNHFDRNFGQNKAVVSVFNGSVVYCNVGIVLIFLARVVVLVKNFTSAYFS